MDLLKEEQCSLSLSLSESLSSSNSSSNNNINIINNNCNSNNINSNSNSNGNSELKKCTDCQTTTTPLWRGGPAGPKTLCNACGIKYHKKRRALLGIEKGKVEKCKKKIINNHHPNNNSVNNKIVINNGAKTTVGMPLKIKVMASGIRQSDKLGEVEQAAMLLMALSYGSVYA